jgi:ADP-ribosylglycohydrolase
MVAAACRYSAATAGMMAQAIDEARSGVGPEVTLGRLQGWAAHEAIAAAVYLLERHPDDARAAILEGANTPGDSDSIATLAGALLGARLGVDRLPAEWVRDVERSSELTALALEI